MGMSEIPGHPFFLRLWLFGKNTFADLGLNGKIIWYVFVEPLAVLRFVDVRVLK